MASEFEPDVRILDTQGDFYPSLVGRQWSHYDDDLRGDLDDEQLRWLFESACTSLGQGPNERAQRIRALLPAPRHLVVADTLLRAIPAASVDSIDGRELVAFAFRHLYTIVEGTPYGYVRMDEDEETREAFEEAARGRYGTREQLAWRVASLAIPTAERLLPYGRTLALGNALAAALDFWEPSHGWADEFERLACDPSADPRAAEWIVLEIAVGTWSSGLAALERMVGCGVPHTVEAAKAWLSGYEAAWNRFIEFVDRQEQGFTWPEAVRALEPGVPMWTSRVGRQLMRVIDDASMRGVTTFRDGRFYRARR